MSGDKIMYSLAGLLIVLGFLALVKQKTYINKQTGRVTEITLPILGKLKTNYPALAFVFLGVSIAFFAFSKTPDFVRWSVTGDLDLPSSSSNSLSWQQGSLEIIPKQFSAYIHPNGTFEVTGNIGKGKTFEQVVDRIIFTCGEYSGNLSPCEEYDKYNESQTSLLKSIKPTKRTYRLPIKYFNSQGENSITRKED